MWPSTCSSIFPGNTGTRWTLSVRSWQLRPAAAREPALSSEIFHCARIFLSWRRAALPVAGLESREKSRGVSLFAGT